MHDEVKKYGLAYPQWCEENGREDNAESQRLFLLNVEV